MGEADDPFFPDLRVFDLLYGGDLVRGRAGHAGRDNVNTWALQLPLAAVTANGDAARNPVIGVWSDTERYSMQLSPGKATRTGDPVQVSRLGNPLVNEVVLPAGLKDAFNGLTPSKDATIPEVVARVTDPELPEAHRGDLRRAGAGGPAQRPGRDLPDRHREGRADARRLGRSDPGRPELPRAERRQGRRSSPRRCCG